MSTSSSSSSSSGLPGNQFARIFSVAVANEKVALGKQKHTKHTEPKPILNLPTQKHDSCPSMVLITSCGAWLHLVQLGSRPAVEMKEQQKVSELSVNVSCCCPHVGQIKMKKCLNCISLDEQAWKYKERESQVYNDLPLPVTSWSPKGKGKAPWALQLKCAHGRDVAIQFSRASKDLHWCSHLWDNRPQPVLFLSTLSDAFGSSWTLCVFNS